MNTDVTAIVSTPEERRAAAARALRQIELMFMVIERTLTRFDPESELSALNASSGKLFKATPLLFEVVKSALKAAELTGGVFDPTILPQLHSAGYDCSFEKIDKEKANGQPVIVKKYSWKDIKIYPEDLTVCLPEGCSLDLGGIGKGWAVDEVSEVMESFPGYVIDAGGDIRLAGRQANGSRWTVGIADPFNESHDVRVLELSEGAICTSTCARRRWQLNGEPKHHLIDPRTGKPAESGVVSATVIAESAVKAETLAKSALILGPQDGLRLIDNQPGARCLLILQDRRSVSSAGFPEALFAA